METLTPAMLGHSRRTFVYGFAPGGLGGVPWTCCGCRRTRQRRLATFSPAPGLTLYPCSPPPCPVACVSLTGHRAAWRPRGEGSRGVTGAAIKELPVSPETRRPRSRSPIFYLNLNLRRIEADAAKQGIWGANWKHEVLEDLLHDGHLHVSKSHDRRDPTKTVWYCRGKDVSLSVVPDSRHRDTLFCIGLVAGPRRGGPAAGGPIAQVPGPWGLDTMRTRSRASITAEEHLLLSMAAIERRQPTVGSAWNTALADELAAIAPKAIEAHGAAEQPKPQSPRGLARQSRTSPHTSARRKASGAEREATSVTPAVAGPAPPRGPSPANLKPQGSPASRSRLELRSSEVREAADSRLDASRRQQSTDGRPATAPSTDLDATAPPDDVTTSPDSLEFSSAPAPVELIEAGSWLSLCARLLGQLDSGLDGLIGAQDPEEARRSRIARLDAEMARLQAKREAVPTLDRLAQAVDLLHDLADQGARAVSVPPSRVVVDGPGTLRSLSVALADGLVEALPPWVFDRTGAEGSPSKPDVYGTPTLQEQLLAAAAWIREEFGGVPPEGLAQAPRPDLGGSTAIRLAQAWRAEQGLRELTEGLPDFVVARLRSLKGGETRAAAESIGHWREYLGSEGYQGLLSALEGVDDEGLRETVSTEGLSALASEDLAILKHLPWDQVVSFVRRRAAEVPPVETLTTSAKLPSVAPTDDSPPRVLEFRHVVTDASAHVIAASVVVPEPAASATFVGFEVPIRLYATAPVSTDVEVKLRSVSFAGLPKDVDLGPDVEVAVVKGMRTLVWTLPADPDQWRRARDGVRWEREGRVRLGVTRGVAAKLRTGKEPVSVSLEYESSSTTLRFDRVLAALPETFTGARTGIGDASATDLVRNSPLGPQTRHRKLEDVIDEGRHSFMVVAPRRFGKTTLLSHLAAVAREKGRQVVRVTLSREIQPQQAVTDVWSQILAELAKAHGMQPAGPPPTSLVDEASWARVRAFVQQRGFERMTVFIDEAQALVPRSGARWGTDLKNFVERHLAEKSDGLATVQIALFGTVDLSVRVGQNCRDFLLTHGAEQFAFDEASLSRFVRQAGHEQVQSSRLARVELATWAINVHTLTAVFDAVLQRLQGERRLFLLRSDVAEAVARLVEADSSVGTSIWTSARSELSHSDDWDPADSMPLALAWAQQDPLLGQIERLNRCVTWLNGELRAAGASGEVPRERADTALKELKARGVLRDDGGFHRPLLGELLARRTTLLRDDRPGQLALLRLAVDVVEWPDDAMNTAEGAQAKVFLAEQGGRSRAFRTSTLQTEEDGRRFARTCAALRTLRDRRTRRDGDEHLPKISQAGFRADDSRQGVVVYDWVEGQPLEDVWTTLAPDARVHIVTQIARATSALHSRGVLHCDIAPRNVIVNGRLEAVLIDFGLARHVEDETQTRLGNDRFKAPEQCADNPESTEASDVYALGQVLLGPQPDDTGLEQQLLVLAQKMVEGQVDSRPTLDAVIDALSGVQFDQRLHTLTRAVEDIVNDTPEYLWEDLLAYSTTAALVHGGLLRWDLQRCLEACDLLNKLFARVVDDARTPEAVALAALSEGSGELSLAKAAHLVGTTNPVTAVWKSDEVRAVGILRIGWAHPTKRERKVSAARRLLKTAKRNQLEVFRHAVEKTAAAVDSAADAGGSVCQFVDLIAGSE